MVDYENAITETQEIDTWHLVNTIIAGAASIPASIKQKPSTCLLERPRRIDILKCAGERSQHRHSHVRNPIECVLLPRQRIEWTRTNATNLDCSYGGRI